MRLESNNSRIRRFDRRATSQARPPLLRCLVSVLLAGVLFTLIPLAHSNPPDPTWIAGLYDDADHDDAVLAIIDGVGLPVTARPTLAHADLSSASVVLAGPTWPSEGVRISLADRAPPLR